MTGHQVIGWGALAYQIGCEMTCPCCGGRQWDVGRLHAECITCAAIFPIENSPHIKNEKDHDHGQT